MERGLFYNIIKLVKNRENYVPRNYQTVGGMWTVDTYKLDNVVVQLMDEGYTLRLITEEVIATDYANKFEIEKGTEKDLKELYKKLARD
jgi:hypothetical protein